MKRILLLLLLTSFLCHAQTGYIKTIAGSGSAGHSGDGGLATAASLHTPVSTAFDKFGNIYIADDSNNCIRKINTTGIIATIAGTGTAGFSGDGGAASAAQLHSPTCVATDRAGNVYVADRNNNRIRKINTSGIITTCAGTGTAGFNSDSIAATAANLNSPNGIAVDANGNLFIADVMNNRVRKVDTSGIITTYAGTGVAGYTGDYGVATAARLNQPVGLTIDINENLYLSDSANSCVRIVSIYGIINTVAGTGTEGYGGDHGPATAATLSGPAGLAVDAIGTLFIADSHNNRIRRVDTAGTITTIAGTGTAGYSGDGGPATAASLNNPLGVAIDNTGNAYIADASTNRARYILLNHIPYFTGGTYQSFSVCESASATSINAYLSVIDSDAGQEETWAVVSAPHNGTLGGFNTSAFSAGDTIRPTGLSYTPTRFYHGNDTFRVSITDGDASDSIDIYVNVMALPNGGHVTGADSVCPGGHDTLMDIAATPGGTWSHTDTFIVFGTVPGSLTGVHPGTEYVKYVVTTVCGSDSASLRVTVNPAPISGTIVGGPDSICIGTHITLANPTATPYGVWSTTDTSIASILASGPDTCFVTGTGGGSVTILYNAFTHCGSSPAYMDIVVSPHPGTITGADFVCLGTTDTLSNLITGGVWASADHSVATISSTGVVSAVSIGHTTISYTVTSALCGTGTATFPIEVLGLPVHGTISGLSALCIGDSTTLIDTVSGGRWSSSADTLAVVDSVTGKVHAIARGIAYISYTVATSCGTVDTFYHLTVNGAPIIAPISGPDSVCVGSTVVDSVSPGSGTWTMNNGFGRLATGTATTTGFSGVTTGLDTLKYTLSNTCGTTTVTRQVRIITTAGPGTITGTTNVCAGDSITLSDTVSGGVWSSGSTAMATVHPLSGIVFGASAGTAIISYSKTNSCGTTVATKPVTVVPLPAGVVFSGPDVVCPGRADTVAASITGGSWAALNAKASVISSATGGIITGVSPGLDTLTYTATNYCGTGNNSFIISVTAPPVAGIITGDSTLCRGSLLTLADTIRSGSWGSSITSIATVNATTGVVTGVLQGTDTIHYSITNSCATTTVYHKIVVMPMPSAGSISGPAVVCAGSSIELTDTATGGSWSTRNSHITLTGDTATGVSRGADTITYTVTTMCGTASVTHIVAVDDVPIVHPISGPSIICPGNSDTLRDATPGGTWSSATGHISVTGAVATGVTVGVDTIYYILSNSCGSSVALLPVAVNRFLVPSVSTTVSPDSNICSGNSAIFTAIATNGGTAPFVQWKKSGVNVATGASYSYIPTAADVISCAMVSDNACADTDTVFSRGINITVTGYETPETRIAASIGDSVVEDGTLVTFTANVSYCGPSPIFQWFLNGHAVPGATDSTYLLTANAIDTVWCIVSCDLLCATTPFNHTNTIVVVTRNAGIQTLTSNAGEFTIFPNPSHGRFLLGGFTPGNTNDAVKYDVLNLTGKVVYANSLYSDKGYISQRVDLDKNISPGQYLLRVFTADGVAYMYLVIE